MKTLSARKALSAVKQKLRFDGWINSITGLGGSRDSNTSHAFYADALIDLPTLDALFTGNDLARTIVSAKVDDALRRGFCIKPPKGLEDEAEAERYEDALNRWDVQGKVHEAAIWGRLFGGSLLVFGVEGIQEEPLDLGTIGQGDLRSLKVFDLRDIEIKEAYQDPSLSNYGQPMIYEIRAAESLFGGGTGVLVHESRCVRFGGALTTRTTRRNNGGWDVSELQACYDALRDANANWQSMCALIKDFGQGVFKIKGLFDMLVAGKEDVMRRRMELVDEGRSVLRSLILDTDEEDYERKATPVSGLDVLIDKTWQRLAAAANMPVTRLLGMSPAGLNATGDSDMRNYYDTVESYRTTKLLAPLRQVCTVVGLTEGIPNANQWEVTFPSLWQPTDKEKADAAKVKADADKVYIDTGVLLPEEVAIARFGGNESDIKIDVESRQKALAATLSSVAGEIDVKIKQVPLNPTSAAAVLTVNEARATQGLGPIEGGEVTVTEYQALKASVGQDRAGGISAKPVRDPGEKE